MNKSITDALENYQEDPELDNNSVDQYQTLKDIANEVYDATVLAYKDWQKDVELNSQRATNAIINAMEGKNEKGEQAANPIPIDALVLVPAKIVPL